MMRVAVEVKKLNQILFWVKPMSDADYQRILLAPSNFCGSPLEDWIGGRGVGSNPKVCLGADGGYSITRLIGNCL